MGLTTEANGNNRWDWEGNRNKTWLNMGTGMGMGMNSWEWYRTGIKKDIPAHLYSTVQGFTPNGEYRHPLSKAII